MKNFIFIILLSLIYVSCDESINMDDNTYLDDTLIEEVIEDVLILGDTDSVVDTLSSDTCKTICQTTQRIEIDTIVDAVDVAYQGIEIWFNPVIVTTKNIRKKTVLRIYEDLERSVDTLNASFKGLVTFKVRDTIWTANVKKDYPDINIETVGEKYSSYSKTGTFVLDYEDEGFINLFITPNSKDRVYRLMGFTWIPQVEAMGDMFFNRIYVSQEGNADTGTLRHEIGHFLGLGHTAEHDVCEYGRCYNYMSYCSCTNEFTALQYDTMATVIVNLRDDLIK